jgi:hypothetical protein
MLKRYLGPRIFVLIHLKITRCPDKPSRRRLSLIRNHHHTALSHARKATETDSQVKDGVEHRVIDPLSYTKYTR